MILREIEYKNQIIRYSDSDFVVSRSKLKVDFKARRTNKDQASLFRRVLALLLLIHKSSIYFVSVRHTIRSDLGLQAYLAP